MLEKEILQEKNVILQCLRYIADNNYFGKGENNAAEPAKTNEPDSTTKPEIIQEIDSVETVDKDIADSVKEEASPITSNDMEVTEPCRY